MAARAEEVGVAKTRMRFGPKFALAVLAGAFIALGAVFATVVSTGVSPALPYGIIKLLAGLAFCLGLVLVVVGGAELFTGNNLKIMAWASGKVSSGQLLRNWTIVYVGNFVGAVLTAGMVFLSGQYLGAGGALGLNALQIAAAKTGLGFLPALILGIFCNALVCLAVWMCMGARTTADKILAILFPITAFVAAGFEHCVANMYFIPIGLFIKSGAVPAFWGGLGLSAADFSGLTWGAFLVRNLLPVTIGNMIGGVVMVGLMYWFIYLHPLHRSQATQSAV